MDKVVVRVEGVSKTIKKQRIVSDISFTLNQGGILALCGGNGAGKSTVLRMLAGILPPTSGSIIVNGVSHEQKTLLYSRQLGYMPDDFQFQPGFTAQETISFWAALRKVPKERAKEVFALVGLENAAEKRVGSFSKGMRQRLLLAQAILAKPPLLLMDEPTNGLDPFWTREFIRLLDQVRQDGSTVIFSTHQLEVAGEAAEQVMFLNQGRVVGKGDVRSFRDRYPSLHEAFHASLGLE
ncbi:ABC transporter ATP-binding protein [Paenibacillus sp. FSL M7-1455]|uniref:ABC transporter ATP-binding protein n=1 Tax=Paenibacillus sp. FSL M7-1455 TaxID=2975316 RepID=UPI0030FAB73C